MPHPLRRYTVGALAAGSVAAAVLAVPFTGGPSWTPVTKGLAEDPDRMLPATVSAAHPVSVVSTALDSSGRPVVTTHRATDRAVAESLIRAGQKAPHAVAVELDAPVHVLDAPTGTDPYRGWQWDLTKIGVPTAWERSTGAGTTVAVVDTGVDSAHPDLAGQVLAGVDLVAGTSGASSDPNGHGTHVAGTIAAVAGNGVGVAGIAPDATVLPVRVMDASGNGTMSTVATGITWAADHGAQVINLSLGSETQVSAVTNAVAYARSKGVVVVAAAGNDRTSGSPALYPAADPGVIAVAATDSTDTYSSFSNQGDYVDVAAPGSDILSTIPTALGSYAYYSGTSMASPHVAAIAALLEAYAPTLGPDRVEQALETSAVDLGAPGRDADYGYGRVDAGAVLAAVIPSNTSPSVPASSATPKPTGTTAPTIPPTTAPTTPPAEPTTTPTGPAVNPTTTPSAEPTETPTAAPTAEPVTPVVTSHAKSRLITYGTPTSTTFIVTVHGRRWIRQPAQACIAEGGAAFRCAAITTSATGTVTVTRAAMASYQVKLVATATATSREATSATYAYTVRAAATAVRSGAGSLTATLNGAVGQNVQVQRWDGDTWRTVTTYRAVPRAVVHGLQPRHAYRIAVPSTSMITGTSSNSVWM